MSNYHTKELNLRFVKLTLGQFQREVEISEAFEDEVNFVVEVSCQMCSDRKVIHVNHQPLFTYVVGKVVVHKLLESRG